MNETWFLRGAACSLGHPELVEIASILGKAFPDLSIAIVHAVESAGETTPVVDSTTELRAALGLLRNFITTLLWQVESELINSKLGVRAQAQLLSWFTAVSAERVWLIEKALTMPDAADRLSVELTLRSFHDGHFKNELPSVFIGESPLLVELAVYLYVAKSRVATISMMLGLDEGGNELDHLRDTIPGRVLRLLSNEPGTRSPLRSK